MNNSFPYSLVLNKERNSATQKEQKRKEKHANACSKNGTPSKNLPLKLGRLKISEFPKTTPIEILCL